MTEVKVSAEVRHMKVHCSLARVGTESGYISRTISAMDCRPGSAYCLTTRLIRYAYCAQNVSPLHVGLSDQSYSRSNTDLGLRVHSSVATHRKG